MTSHRHCYATSRWTARSIQRHSLTAPCYCFMVSATARYWSATPLLIGDSTALKGWIDLTLRRVTEQRLFIIILNYSELFLKLCIMYLCVVLNGVDLGRSFFMQKVLRHSFRGMGRRRALKGIQSLLLLFLFKQIPLLRYTIPKILGIFKTFTSQNTWENVEEVS